MQFTQEDRDVLLKHDVKISTLCSEIKDLRKDVKDGFKDLGNKLENNSLNCFNYRTECKKDINDDLKTYMPKRLFIWILSIIIFGTISLAAYTGTISNAVNLNTHKINDINKISDTNTANTANTARVIKK